MNPYPMSARIVRAYHFVGETLRDGRPVPPDGEWLIHEGKCVMCESGLHASRHPFDALTYAPGPILCQVECLGIEDEQPDKLVCRERRIVARFDASDLLWEMARMCALDVIHLWDAPEEVVHFLKTGTGRDAARAAATDAAGAAARASAWDAAWDAATASAWDEAWYAARDAARAAATASAWYAARDAAWDAAWYAAWDAATASAWDEAWYAARDAAKKKQRARFARLANNEFRKLGVKI